ncbi:uncharacterized protein LOC106884357 isoform X1 [Octopus bimaculoides]|uniref:Phytanoyl-CoA dioxygenase n=1 Tax=Octopus bimaculoides TaxID=37653 RepID=A0A0L8I3P5_OCTBM|nr:uncharacterized protein LOC106884357 isoform X1 [Octopus bimaculoides]|eukprot:XP_014791187.1 PREDICTED: uncharacterized protein LOC106884357 [Octopus bimaculoides]
MESTDPKSSLLGQNNELYSNVFTEIPPQPKISKPGHLTEEQIKKFFDEGFLIVNDLFTPEELQPCCNDIEILVDNLAQKLYKAGKISDLHEDCGLFQRLTEIDKEFSGASILIFKSQKLTKSFQNLWSNERLLNIAEQILGPEISGHPVWNLRPKIPNSKIVQVPWHQDSAYFDPDSYDHMILTAWIPFLNTNARNGGMQMARYGHHTGKIAHHTCSPGDTWYVDLAEEEMQKTLGVDLERDIITCHVPYGGMLLFQNITPHRSLLNISNDVRWSVDLRWQSPKEKWGFYNLQEGILMRSEKQPNLEPDWEKFLSTDRKTEWQKRYSKKDENIDDEFNTCVSGPWFNRWEIVHHNRHIESFRFDNEEANI